MELSAQGHFSNIYFFIFFGSSVFTLFFHLRPDTKTFHPKIRKFIPKYGKPSIYCRTAFSITGMVGAVVQYLQYFLIKGLDILVSKLKNIVLN